MKTTLHASDILMMAIVLAASSAAFGQIYPPGTSQPAVLPAFDPTLFDSSSATVTNPYFPLTPNRVYTYSGEQDADGETETVVTQTFVTTNTRNILGVQARVVQDTEWVNGQLVEDTFDWFAQDTAGNVWYFGEDTRDFLYDDEGNLLGTDNSGSWEAGVDGAQAGYFMLADPDPGDHYYLEFLPGEAEDEAVVVALGLDVSTDLGDFSDVLQTYETTALEPDEREYKYYAPGLGLFLIEEDLDENLANPEFTMELIDVQTIPEPMSLSLVAVGLGGLTWIRRRAR
jgi:hypothetical protein